MKDKVIELFLAGQGVNHIMFLLNYEYSIDVINQVIRERLQELLPAGRTAPQAAL